MGNDDDELDVIDLDEERALREEPNDDEGPLWLEASDVGVEIDSQGGDAFRIEARAFRLRDDGSGAVDRGARPLGVAHADGGARRGVASRGDGLQALPGEKAPA